MIVSVNNGHCDTRIYAVQGVLDLEPLEASQFVHFSLVVVRARAAFAFAIACLLLSIFRHVGKYYSSTVHSLL
jgi:hypothetical protein